MTAILLIAATVILLVLIIWRGASPQFRRGSELPKYQFLRNLGLGSRQSSELEPPTPSTRHDSTKENHESDEP